MQLHVLFVNGKCQIGIWPKWSLMAFYKLYNKQINMCIYIFIQIIKASSVVYFYDILVFKLDKIIISCFYLVLWKYSKKFLHQFPLFPVYFI
jgi:hypothetical protein